MAEAIKSHLAPLKAMLPAAPAAVPSGAAFALASALESPIELLPFPLSELPAPPVLAEVPAPPAATVSTPLPVAVSAVVASVSAVVAVPAIPKLDPGPGLSFVISEPAPVPAVNPPSVADVSAELSAPALPGPLSNPSANEVVEDPAWFEAALASAEESVAEKPKPKTLGVFTPNPAPEDASEPAMLRDLDFKPASAATRRLFSFLEEKTSWFASKQGSAAATTQRITASANPVFIFV